jgi:hypothetical protein
MHCPPLFAECKGPKTKSPQCIPHDYKRTAIPCQGYFSTYYNRRLCQLDRPAYLALLVLRGHKRRTRSPESRNNTVWSRAGSRLQRKPPRGMVSRKTLEMSLSQRAKMWYLLEGVAAAVGGATGACGRVDHPKRGENGFRGRGFEEAEGKGQARPP